MMTITKKNKICSPECIAKAIRLKERGLQMVTKRNRRMLIGLCGKVKLTPEQMEVKAANTRKMREVIDFASREVACTIRDKICEACEVSVPSFQNWRYGNSNIPLLYRRMMELITDGVLLFRYTEEEREFIESHDL